MDVTYGNRNRTRLADYARAAQVQTYVNTSSAKKEKGKEKKRIDCQVREERMSDEGMNLARREVLGGCVQSRACIYPKFSLLEG